MKGPAQQLCDVSQLAPTLWAHSLLKMGKPILTRCSDWERERWSVLEVSSIGLSHHHFAQWVWLCPQEGSGQR